MRSCSRKCNEKCPSGYFSISICRDGRAPSLHTEHAPSLHTKLYPIYILEFLSDDKVQVTTATFTIRSIIRLVETISPVESHQTDHRQEYTDTDTGGAFQVKRIKILQISPSVTSLHKYQSVDRRRNGSSKNGYLNSIAKRE